METVWEYFYILTQSTDTRSDQWPPKCSSVNQTFAAACLSVIFRLLTKLFRKITVSDKLWCVLIASIVVWVRPKEIGSALNKGQSCSTLPQIHTCTHWSTIFIPLPLLSPPSIDSANRAEKHYLLSVLQRSEWGVGWVGCELAVTDMRSERDTNIHPLLVQVSIVPLPTLKGPINPTIHTYTQIISVLLAKVGVLKTWKTTFKKLNNIVFLFPVSLPLGILHKLNYQQYSGGKITL